MQRLLLFLSCLLICASDGQAQRWLPSYSIAPPREGEDFSQKNRYPGGLQLVEMNLKISVRSYWEGGTVRMADELLGNPDIRRAWDISPDQYLRLVEEAWENVHEEMQHDPELQRLQVLMNDVDVEGMKIRGFDEESLAIVYAQGKRSDELMTIRLSDAFDNTLTPEQRQTMNEAFLASMSELPIVFPDMFEALDLTDTQKRQMGEIKKELDAEFEQTLDDFVAYQMMLRDMLIDEMGRQGIESIKTGVSREESAMARSDFSQKTRIALNKLAEDREFKRIQDAIRSKTGAFSLQFKTRMFDVLTDEQWNRLQALTDNPPEHAKILLAHLKKQQGESGETDGGASGWAPGPDSWRPGVAIPEQYRRERNTRGGFPRPQ